MTITTTLNWHQPDERADGRDDSAWYTYQTNHDAVVTVSNGDREITVYADGEMRVHIDIDGDIVVVRYCDRLPENGINNDKELYKATDEERAEFINNSWFDLYATDHNIGDDGWLDCVSHTLTEAIEQATALLSEDSIWEETE